MILMSRSPIVFGWELDEGWEKTAVLCYNAHMQQVNFLSQNQYPTLHENGEVTAVVIDINSFRQIKIVLDNLLNRKQEPEDEVVAAASALWQRMIQDAKLENSNSDWVAELDDL